MVACTKTCEFALLRNCCHLQYDKHVVVGYSPGRRGFQLCENGPGFCMGQSGTMLGLHNFYGKFDETFGSKELTCRVGGQEDITPEKNMFSKKTF